MSWRETLNWRRWSIANSSGWLWRRRKKSKTGECCSYQKAQFGHGDGQRKKIKTGEDGSYRATLVSPDYVVNVSVVAHKPILKSWQLRLSFKLDFLTT